MKRIEGKEYVLLSELSLHPEAESTPRMLSEQYDALKMHIDEHGQQDPATLYRGRIVDGRHRRLVLQDLGIEFMMIERMPNNSTLSDIKNKVTGKETRRHETAAQLAISAWYLFKKSKNSLTQAEAARTIGANRKRITEAKQIEESYGRPDILRHLFDGEKFNIGTSAIPFWTDSLGSILRWLADNGTIEKEDKRESSSLRLELTENENIATNRILNSIKGEAQAEKYEIASRLYAELKAGDRDA